MTDERFLEALARAGREREVAADPRWEGLSRGTLSADEKIALEAWAAASPEARAAHAAFQPLGSDVRDRILDAALSSSRPPPRPWRRAGLVAACSAAALGLALVCLQPPARAPSFHLVVAGGERDQRGPTEPTDAVPRVGPGSRIEITLTPDTTVRGPVAVRAFLVQDGRARDWSPRLEVSESGARRLAGEREALFPGVPAGRWEVVFAVGLPASLPKDAGALAALLAAKDAGGVQLLRQPLLLTGAPAP